MNIDFIEFIKVVLIGIIEGITEWLPISSTGHMLLFDEFIPLSMSEKFKEMFFVVIQLGAIIAVVAVFWRKMLPFSFDKLTGFELKTNVIMMWVHVFIACIPAAVLGLLFDDFLEEHFGNALTISLMLIIYGIIFIIIENRKKASKINSISEINYITALLIGCFQALSMIPGTSRSGATIIGALLLGVSRTVSAEFTFYLAVPTMFGASLIKLVKFGIDFSMNEVVVLLVGMVVAFAVSMFAINFLMDYVKRHNFKPFGYYRIILGIIVLLITFL